MASGLSWANNNKNYFDQYHEGEEIGKSEKSFWSIKINLDRSVKPH